LTAPAFAAIDRAAPLRRPHAIARQARPHMASYYEEALDYGLKTAWGLIASQSDWIRP
jgi:hypothetical protein